MQMTGWIYRAERSKMNPEIMAEKPEITTKPEYLTEKSEKDNGWGDVTPFAADLEKQSGLDKKVKPMNRVVAIIVAISFLIFVVMGLLLAIYALANFVIKDFRYRFHQQEWLQTINYIGLKVSATTREKLYFYQVDLGIQLGSCVTWCASFAFFSFAHFSSLRKEITKRGEFKSRGFSDIEFNGPIFSITCFLICFAIFAVDLWSAWTEFQKVTLLKKGL